MTHRIPFRPLTDNMTGRLDPAYEAEVERSTEKSVREYAAAQRRLEAAERRAEKAVREAQEARSPKERRLTKKQLAVAWALVEFRREELNLLHAQMTASPAGAAHRGDRSYHPVPARHGGVL